MKKMLIVLGVLFSTVSIAHAQDIPHMRVHLKAPELQVYLLKSNGDMTVSDSKKSVVVSKGVPVLVVKGGAQVISRVKNDILRGPKLTFSAEEGKYVEVPNWKRTYAWDKSMNVNDNKFLGAIDVYPEGKGLMLVNDIDLESYMKGVAEVPEGDENEKRKALAVLARSYAAHYVSTDNKKFEDTRYNSSDDPQVFQKYLGYGWTLRSPKWQQALKDTEHEVMMFGDEVLRPAYSSCSGSIGRRKTPVEAGWNKPYFEKTVSVFPAVADPLGIDLVREKSNTCGHGVGLSGLGATNMSKEGKTYTEILDYYYNNYTLEKVK